MSGEPTTLVIEGPAYALPFDVPAETILSPGWYGVTDPAKLAPHCLADAGLDPAFTGGSWPVVMCGGMWAGGALRPQQAAALHGAGVRAIVAPAFSPLFVEHCLNNAWALPLTVPALTLPAVGTPVRIELGGGTLRLAWEGGVHRAPLTLPDWALARKPWLDVIGEQAAAHGGLEGLRRRLAEGARLF